MHINVAAVKQLFGIDPGVRVRVHKLKNGFKIVLINTRGRLHIGHRCERCGSTINLHPHHIIPRSAGGGDEDDNLLTLCFRCHVGDDGIHLKKWEITEIVDVSKYEELKERYKHGGR